MLYIRDALVALRCESLIPLFEGKLFQCILLERYFYNLQRYTNARFMHFDMHVDRHAVRNSTYCIDHYTAYWKITAINLVAYNVPGSVHV